jgi:hypothetical protein
MIWLPLAFASATPSFMPRRLILALKLASLTWSPEAADGLADDVPRHRSETPASPSQAYLDLAAVSPHIQNRF